MFCLQVLTVGSTKLNDKERELVNKNVIGMSREEKRDKTLKRIYEKGEDQTQKIPKVTWADLVKGVTTTILGANHGC